MSEAQTRTWTERFRRKRDKSSKPTVAEEAEWTKEYLALDPADRAAVTEIMKSGMTSRDPDAEVPEPPALELEPSPPPEPDQGPPAETAPEPPREVRTGPPLASILDEQRGMRAALETIAESNERIVQGLGTIYKMLRDERKS